MKQNARFILWLAVVALLAVVAVIDLAEGRVDIAANQSYTYEYNGTGSELFFCELPNKVSFCSTASLNISLDPGETQTFDGVYSPVTLRCDAQVQNSTVCSIDKVLDPGETYTNDGGACDIHIRVDEEDDDDDEPFREYEFEERVTINFLEEDIVRIQAGNRTFDVDLANGVLENIEYRIPFTCPVKLTPEELVEDDVVLSMCRSLLPELSSAYVNTADECVKANTQMVLGLGSLYTNATESNMHVATAEAQHTICQGTVDLLRNQTSECQQDVATLQAQLESEKDQKHMSWTIIIILLMTNGVTAYVLIRGDQ